MILLDFTFPQLWDLAGSCFSELASLSPRNESHHSWARVLCQVLGTFPLKFSIMFPLRKPVRTEFLKCIPPHPNTSRQGRESLRVIKVGDGRLVQYLG